MSDPTTTLLEGFEPSIYRLTVGRLNRLATEARVEADSILTSGPTTLTPGGTRTRDRWIRSPALYPLSYGGLGSLGYGV